MRTLERAVHAGRAVMCSAWGAGGRGSLPAAGCACVGVGVGTRAAHPGWGCQHPFLPAGRPTGVQRERHHHPELCRAGGAGRRGQRRGPAPPGAAGRGGPLERAHLRVWWGCLCACWPAGLRAGKGNRVQGQQGLAGRSGRQLCKVEAHAAHAVGACRLRLCWQSSGRMLPASTPWLGGPGPPPSAVSGACWLRGLEM